MADSLKHVYIFIDKITDRIEAILDVLRDINNKIINMDDRIVALEKRRMHGGSKKRTRKHKK